jgi:hypothetical protein
MGTMKQEYRYCPMCATTLEQRIIEGKERKACPNCGFVDYKNPLPVAVAITMKDNCFLLIKRGLAPRKGTWSSASGFIEVGETPEDPLHLRHRALGAAARNASGCRTETRIDHTGGIKELHERISRGEEGMTVYVSGWHRQKIAQMEKALSLQPNFLEALDLIAVVYMNQKENKKAIERVEAQIKTSPQNPFFYSILGSPYAK